MRILATIAVISAVFAAGITTNSVSASAREHCDTGECMGGGGERHDDRGFNNFGGYNNFGGFGFGVVPYYQPYYVPYYQPYYAPYYQPYRVSHSCWRWSHARHHRVWVCGRHHY